MRAHNRTDRNRTPGRRGVPCALLLACVAGLVAAGASPAGGQSIFSYGARKAEPLVLVVHGVGGGNRDDGWSTTYQQAWRIGEVREITFRNDTHDETSYTDASYYAGDWALSVQSQIKQAVAQNPGRPIVIVSHSWGTVATSMALSGGSGGGKTRELTLQGNQIHPLDLGGARITEWITLGSPINGSTLPLLNVDVSDRLPPQVNHWTNFYDPADPVSKGSTNLQGAQNVEVTGSGSRFDPFGITAHKGIWVNPAVTRFLQETLSRATSTPATPPARPTTRTPTVRTQPPVARNQPPAGGSATWPPQAGGTQDSSVVCQSAMVAIERYNQKLYGPDFRRVTWTPPFHYENGDCVGGFTVWAQKPGQPEWSPLIWNADTGQGRVPTQNLIQTYAKDNPDLPWSSQGGMPQSRGTAPAPNYAQTCQSAMTAIERHFRSNWGSEFLRVEWAFPFRYDNGSCVGGYTVWAQKPGQPPWAPLIWNADTGAGRVSLQQLIQEYGAKNPDLTWVAPRQ